MVHLFRIMDNGLRKSKWSCCGHELPREELTFFAQVGLIYIVVIACVINLSLCIGNTSLWSALLAGALGYLLPSPKLENNVPFLSNSSVEFVDGVLPDEHVVELQNQNTNSDDVERGLGSGLVRN